MGRTWAFLLLLIRRRTTSPLFPYTTLFRSPVEVQMRHRRPVAPVAPPDGERRRDHRALDPEGPAGPAHERRLAAAQLAAEDRKSTRLNSSHSSISYAVFCLKKKTGPLIVSD